MVTGSSVLGVTYEGGVVLAADKLGKLCYCKLIYCLRWRDMVIVM